MNPLRPIKNAARGMWLSIVARILDRYDGATFSTRRSYRHTPVQSAREDLTHATRETLVGKSRDFEKNSELYNKLADLWEQYVSGTGLQFFATTASNGWNKLADIAWERWKPFADISSRFGFDNLQGVIARSMFVDGEVFVILTRGDGNRPRIQILEGPLCKTPDHLKELDGKWAPGQSGIIDGIEVDKNGRPTAYWFETGREGAHVTYLQVAAFSVVHIFEPSRPGQMRGIPYISCAINTLHDLDDLQMLEMDAAKQNAKVSRFIETATGEFNPESLRQLPGTGGVADAVDGKKRFEHYQETLGAEWQALFQGDKVHQFPGERPSETSREYWKKLEAKVCAGVSIPLVLVYPDSMQGTVYRGALDCANAFFRGKTAVLATHFRRIREYVLNAEGAFYAPLGNRPVDWQACDYLPPAAVNTDVGYNSAAAIAELVAGVKSWDDILLPQGRKAEPVLRRKAALQFHIKKLAKEFTAMGAAEGIEITPEEIASLDIMREPEEASGAATEEDEEPLPEPATK